ncbi:MAG TPA: hypothetical protein VLE91_03850 [Candidatus Saccharimonadales bacterium]|nr:hypothetical protein [Candidatus Saccharimonadales bacterium]
MKKVYSLQSTVYRSGQSLVEVIVAVGVVAALAVALVTTSLVTQKASRGSENSTQATKLVQENIEQIRAFRDRKGFSALANGSCWVLDTTSGSDPANWSLSAANCPRAVVLNQVTFNRSLVVGNNGVNDRAKSALVTVTVTWTDSGGTQSVSNNTVLSNCISSQNLC